MLDALDMPPELLVDAAQSVTEYDSGFAIRFCEGPRGYLNWQAGILRTEARNYRGAGMVTPFQGHVSLFHLLGYGSTRDEAVEMAQNNPHGRNGR